jgi:hypothetical protein
MQMQLMELQKVGNAGTPNNLCMTSHAPQTVDRNTCVFSRKLVPDPTGVAGAFNAGRSSSPSREMRPPG